MMNVLKMILSIGLLLVCYTEVEAEILSKANGLERITQKLVAPPFLPVHEQVATGAPRVVQVRMVVEEKLMKVSLDGATIRAMTFNGSVPGPIVVVHQNDYGLCSRTKL